MVCLRVARPDSKSLALGGSACSTSTNRSKAPFGNQQTSITHTKRDRERQRCRSAMHQHTSNQRAVISLYHTSATIFDQEREMEPILDGLTEIIRIDQEVIEVDGRASTEDVGQLQHSLLGLVSFIGRYTLGSLFLGCNHLPLLSNTSSWLFGRDGNGSIPCNDATQADSSVVRVWSARREQSSIHREQTYIKSVCGMARVNGSAARPRARQSIEEVLELVVVVVVVVEVRDCELTSCVGPVSSSSSLSVDGCLDEEEEQDAPAPLVLDAR
jgi:hypothetical protein